MADAMFLTFRSTPPGHDGYLIYQEGGLYVVGGTSAASPSFAGVMALVVQHTAARQGNAEYRVLFSGRQAEGGRRFRFSRHHQGQQRCAGTEPASPQPSDTIRPLGLGRSTALYWSATGVTPGLSPAFQATSSASSLSVHAGSNNSITLNVTVSGGFDAAVAFSVTGLPSGVTALSRRLRCPLPARAAACSSLRPAAGPRLAFIRSRCGRRAGRRRQSMPVSVTVVRQVSRSAADALRSRSTVHRRAAAPEGAIDDAASAVCLKAYPDTKP